MATAAEEEPQIYVPLDVRILLVEGANATSSDLAELFLTSQRQHSHKFRISQKEQTPKGQKLSTAERHLEGRMTAVA